MPLLDLTPFGFTPTESLAYATLLRIGPSTGYALARGARLARANAYAALEGLVTRGAASKSPGKPARYRPSDPQALLAQLATRQGEALDRLTRELRDFSQPGDPVTKEIAGGRAVANLIQQLVARAERTVQGLLMAELWRPTLPAWRRAGERAQIELRLIGGELPPDAPAWLQLAESTAPRTTMVVVDDAHVVATAGEGDRVAGLWSSHPLVVMMTQRTVRTLQ